MGQSLHDPLKRVPCGFFLLNRLTLCSLHTIVERAGSLSATLFSCNETSSRLQEEAIAGVGLSQTALLENTGSLLQRLSIKDHG